MNELIKVRRKKKNNKKTLKPNKVPHTAFFTSVLAKGHSYYCIKHLFAKRSFVFQACLSYLLLSWSFIIILFLLQLVDLQYLPLRFQWKDDIIIKYVLISVTVYYQIGVSRKQQTQKNISYVSFKLLVNSQPLQR